MSKLPTSLNHSIDRGGSIRTHRDGAAITDDTKLDWTVTSVSVLGVDTGAAVRARILIICTACRR